MSFIYFNIYICYWTCFTVDSISVNVKYDRCSDTHIEEEQDFR